MNLISKSVKLLRYIRSLTADELLMMNLSIPEYGFYDRMPRTNIFIFKDLANNAGLILTHKFTKEELNSNSFIEQYIVNKSNRMIRLKRSHLHTFIIEHYNEYKRLIDADFLQLFNIDSHQLLDVLMLNRKTSFTIIHILLYFYDYDEIRDRLLSVDAFGLPMIYALFDNEYVDKESLFKYVIYTHINIKDFVSKDDLVQFIIDL